MATSLRVLLISMFFVSASTFGLSGCESDKTTAEDVGESIDEGVEEMKDEYDDATTE